MRDSMTDQPPPPNPEIEELRRQIDVLRGEVGALRVQIVSLAAGNPIMEPVGCTQGGDFVAYRGL
jgi:hypothetical protein